MPELGISISGCQLDNNPDTFVDRLNMARDAGFTAIEISPEDFDLISCGELQAYAVDMLKDVLSQYNFKISVHVPLGLNLFNRDNPELHKKVLYECCRLAVSIDAELLVYHPGRYVDSTEFSRYGKVVLSGGTKTKLKEYEVLTLQHLADLYPWLVIAMENLRPYIDYSPYSYAEFLDQLADQVESVNRHNVGIMIDTGHLLLASLYHGYDYMRIIKDKKINPVHFHVNDNHGITTYHTEKDKKGQHAFGRGDEHVVPGTGLFPFKKFFKNFQGYRGTYVIELTDRFFYTARIKESYVNLNSFLDDNENNGLRS